MMLFKHAKGNEHDHVNLLLNSNKNKCRYLIYFKVVDNSWC